jgi:phosphatidylserine/phosphatidylglycerophosphate/cardiolipin synthase-like enzyme
VTEELVRAIRRAAIGLPGADLAVMADALEPHQSPGAAAGAVVVAAIPTERYASFARAIVQAWPLGIPGAAIALALRAGAATAARLRADVDLDVVWTGPQTLPVPVRATMPVLMEVIAGANQQLMVMSFAAYKVPAVVSALRAACDRGVGVHLILEEAAASKNALSHDAKLAFTALGDTVAIWNWPLDARPLVGGKPAVLHAKAAVADERVALVSSANLTANALTQNIELGVIVRGGSIPRRLTQHLTELMSEGILRRVVS